MKFVMTQAVCHEGMQLLDGIADVYVADNQDPNNYLDEMRDAAALIVRIAKCDANAIENSPKLKVIGRTGVGYDSVDVKKATELGIPSRISHHRLYRRAYSCAPVKMCFCQISARALPPLSEASQPCLHSLQSNKSIIHRESVPSEKSEAL